jgi:hypothetical protein
MDSKLQIISGKHRGRKLRLPPDARPTQNRARIALFNMMESGIINNPDYIFISNKKENTVIFVSKKHKVQLIVSLNTTDENLSNTIITIFGCGNSTLKRLKKKNEILYKKGIDK